MTKSVPEKSLDEELAELKDVENKLWNISDKLYFNITQYIEPVNHTSEKQKFFEHLAKGQEYNPKYSYLPKNPIFSHLTLNPEYARIMKELDSIEVERRGIGALIHKRVRMLKTRMEFIRSIGSQDLPAKSVELYGLPDKSLVKYAIRMLEKEVPPSKPELTSEEMVAFLESELAKRKIEWQVLLEENLSAKVVVLSYQRLMKVREDAMFTKKDKARLLLHEVETHVYRYLNGTQQPFKMFVSGTGKDWEMTEEGLATFNEELFGMLNQNQMRVYAGRVLAVHYASSHSFYETFILLREFFDKETAFELTKRVKRGLHDTSIPGGFTKDYYYLAGNLAVKEQVKSLKDLRLLYCGKIALSDLEHIKQLSFLKRPRYLPNYKKAKKLKSFFAR
jgi:uncharacterized protein (TIGR02421 family)